METATPVADPEKGQQNAEDVYQSAVERLPHIEQLRLAALILNHLTGQPMPENYSDEWTEEDYEDAGAASLREFAEKYGSEEDKYEAG